MHITIWWGTSWEAITLKSEVEEYKKTSYRNGFRYDMYRIELVWD